jgi:hypothetical protein
MNLYNYYVAGDDSEEDVDRVAVADVCAASESNITSSDVVPVNKTSSRNQDQPGKVRGGIG